MGRASCSVPARTVCADKPIRCIVLRRIQPMDMPVAERRPVPRILIFATARWQLAARIAIHFADRGCCVEVLAPRGHPAECVASVRTLHRFTPLAPVASVMAALEESTPELVIPCDDAAALLLQRVHQRWQQEPGLATSMTAVLERSMGNVEACVLAGSRSRFMELARSLGVRTPASAAMHSTEGVREWSREYGLPLVLKSDYSFGGQGVAVARRWSEVEQAWAALTRRPGLGESVARALLERDSERLLDWRRAPVEGLMVQAAVEGQPANRAVACWQGEVLAGVSVEALRTQHATGPATVVRIVNSAEMDETARRLVRALGVSGLVGFDFMVEAATGAAHLIEMNVRATPSCHLPTTHGAALVGALLARVRGEPLPRPTARMAPGLVVMFPGEFRADSSSPYLQAAGHDVPWEHPALVRDGLDLPWAERGLLARWRRRWRSSRVPSAQPHGNLLVGAD